MRNNKGVSLIITFFIMTIVLAVILAISTILYSQLKIIRNMGNSVVAFFAADGGVEKVLYYDRHIVPDTGTRGLCYMCDADNDDKCPTDNDDLSTNCMSCVLTPIAGDAEGCDVGKCENCQVIFNTTINDDKSYAITAETTKNNDYIDFNIDSTGSYKQGSYKQVKRAVELYITKTEPGQVITILNARAIPRSVPNGVAIDIQAEVKSLNGVSGVYAIIKWSSASDGSNIIKTLELTCSEININDRQCQGSWNLDSGAYYVDIDAIDMLGNELIERNIKPYIE